MTYDYPYLRAWDHLVGASGDWTRRMIARARREKAPDDVVYHSGGWSSRGRWRTVGTVTAETREKLEGYVEEMRAKERE